MTTGLGAWARARRTGCLGSPRMSPAWVECVTVFIDADPAGERSGNALVEQSEARGLEVVAVRMAEAGHEE